VRGEAALPRGLVSRLVDEFRGRERRRRFVLHDRQNVQLSEREWAVLEGLRDGLTTTELGVRLGISPVTVRRHVSSILAKLRVHSRGAAVALLDDNRS
jgi:DNA-binding NarL/FixJ family response regulator